MSYEKARSKASHDRWLVSYADFITLLFAFFVVLYAFAKADERKQAQVSQAIDSAFRSFGVLSNATAETPPQESAYTATGLPSSPPATILEESVLTPGKVKADLEKMRHELQQSMAKEISERTVSIHMGRDGLVISLREAGFFDSGSALPHLQAIATLKRIAAALSTMPYDVRVEGHTDNVPIHTAEYASNWELSSARATHIARLFLSLHAIAPDKMSAAGYAEFHPQASNDTSEGRATNRRVDLVIMPRTVLNFARMPAGATVEDRNAQNDGLGQRSQTISPTRCRGL